MVRISERRGAYRVLVGRLEEKRPLGRRERGWEDNIKITFQEVGWGDVDCVELAQDGDMCRAFLNEVVNIRVPLNAENFFTS